MEKTADSHDVVEAPVRFDGLTEFEASVLVGALEEFAMRWVDEAPTARALASEARKQLPQDWVGA